jgi:lipooligosaccharide transport system permease protein
VYRHTWRGSVISTFVNPVLFLAAMGLGVGRQIDAGPGAQTLGVEYLPFLAAGLVAANAMQTGAGDGSYPVMSGVKWQKTFEATLATPVTAAQLVYGHLGWVGVRVAFSSAVFATVAMLFGAFGLVRGALAVAPAVLTGVAFAAAATAYTVRLKDVQGLAAMFRFAVIPMFLFSGAFFPVSQLPGWMQPIAYVTPLWHGVELTRWAALGAEPTITPALQIGYLALWAVAGMALAIVGLTKRLMP